MSSGGGGENGEAVEGGVGEVVLVNARPKKVIKGKVSCFNSKTGTTLKRAGEFKKSFAAHIKIVLAYEVANELLTNTTDR